MKLANDRFFRGEFCRRIDTGNIKRFERFTYETTGKGGRIYDVILLEPSLGTKEYAVNCRRVEQPEPIHTEIEKHFSI